MSRLVPHWVSVQLHWHQPFIGIFRYPDSWYEDITTNLKFFAVAATKNHVIIGIIVAEIKPQSKCNREDQGLLSTYTRKDAQVAYILTLGVIETERRNGTASKLLKRLIDHLTKVDENKKCLAVYLHVLTTNSVAISFYERQQFQRHLFLPLYYSIEGSSRDGYSYVLYINDGRPPFNPIYSIGNALHTISKFSINLFVSLFVSIYTIVYRPSFSWFNTSCFKHSIFKKFLQRFVNYTTRLVFRQDARHSKYGHLANA